jgi:WD40 repeat protein
MSEDPASARRGVVDHRHQSPARRGDLSDTRSYSWLLVGWLLLTGPSGFAAETPTSLTFEIPILSLAFSGHGKFLAAGNDSGLVKVWSFPEMEEIVSFADQKEAVRNLAFRPGDTILAAVSSDKTVRIWKTETWKDWGSFKGEQPFIGLGYSPKGPAMALGDVNGTITLLDGSNCKQLGFLKGHSGFINALNFSPDGTLLAGGGRGPDLKLWNVATKKLLADIDCHDDHVTGVTFSPDGKTLYSAALDGTVKLWDVAKRKETATLKGPKDSQLTCMALSPDGKTLAAGGNFKTVALWDTTTLKSLPALEGHTDDILALAFAPDGKTLASSGKDRTVRFWKIGDK